MVSDKDNLIADISRVDRTYPNDAIKHLTKIPVVHQNQIIVLGKMKIATDGI
mgnify:CR=1 FL=1